MNFIDKIYNWLFPKKPNFLIVDLNVNQLHPTKAQEFTEKVKDEISKEINNKNWKIIINPIKLLDTKIKPICHPQTKKKINFILVKLNMFELSIDNYLKLSKKVKNNLSKRLDKSWKIIVAPTTISSTEIEIVYANQINSSKKIDVEKLYSEMSLANKIDHMKKS